MELDFERTDGMVVITACMRVDGSNARDFEKALRDIMQDDDRALVLDFEPLVYISSAGLRALLLTAKSLQKRGAGFGVCALATPIREVFAISGFDKIIATYETKSEAVASLNG